MPQGRRVITPLLYQQLLQGAREKPGNASHMGKVAGCDARTARRGWNTGWPKQGFQPIADMVELEKVEARALLQKQQEEQERARLAASVEFQNKAREQATEAHKQEGQLVNFARGDTLLLLNGIAKVAAVLEPLALRVRKQWQDQAQDQSTPIDEKQFMRNVRMLSLATANAVHAGQMAMELERLYLGKPTSILGLQELPDLSDDEVEREMEAVAAAARRSKERQLRLVPPPVPPETQTG